MRSTRDSRGRERRVVGKADPCFVIASLAASAHGARSLYEDLSCQRDEMEKRIEEYQLDLFANRTSAHSMRANRLRLWFASTAYALLCALRRLGPSPTPASSSPRAETCASNFSRSSHGSASASVASRS